MQNLYPSARKEFHMSKPTILLVHGAFGDASSWRPVFDLLDGGEYSLLAAALPLRGVASDVAYLEAVIDELDGPVVLVGHSYGGFVITLAGVSDKVAALVYVDAFMPDAGESIGDLQARFPSLAMGNFLQPRPLPGGRVELSVDPDRFQNIFCADVPDDVAAFMAHAQRPLVATAFEEPAAVAAWRTKPSWGVFGTGDRPVAPELHRFSLGRAGSSVTEVEGASHFAMVSKPEVVAGVIRDAVTSSAANLVA
jgi:pimeloyl-ACP methyl ester carboxylesterase